MTTYLLRHAPSAYSVDYRVNGDPDVPVLLTADGEASCRAARMRLPLEKIKICVSSAFPRCLRTAELLMGGCAAVLPEPRLGELDYGDFEGGEFVAYARWLAEDGPWLRPPGAAESQREGIHRMLAGLASTLRLPGPRMVIAHGLLVSVVHRVRSQSSAPLLDVFLPDAPCLTPLVLRDDELTAITDRMMQDLDDQIRGHRSWSVDLSVFPVEVRSVFATVSTQGAALKLAREDTNEAADARRPHPA